MVTPEAYRFGPFILDTASMTLLEGDREVEIRPKAFETLLALLRHAGRVVSKDELVAAVWPDVIVNDDALAQCVRDVRKAITDTEQHYIRTVSRRGYMFVHEVTRKAGRPSRSAGRPRPEHRPSTLPMIAVMPFKTLSGGAEQAYFADGIVDDLITALSRFKTFAVVSRSSSFVYKGRAVDARTVARELGVRYLLEGSVRRSDDRIRLTAQLIEGSTGAYRWAEKFDGGGTDVFDIQDRITETVIALIEPQIRKAEIERARKKRPENLDAWDLYVQALPLVHSGVVANWTRALDMLDGAMSLDPGYAPALALAAWAHNKRNQLGGPRLPDFDEDARAAVALAERSVAADPDEALALALHGWMRIHYQLDYSGLQLVRRAVALNPHNTSVLDLASIAHLRAGELDGALSVATRALELSPGAPLRYVFMMHIAGVLNALGRYEEAIDFATGVLALEPAYVNAHLARAIGYAQLGRLEQARKEVATAVRMRPGTTIAAVMVDRMQYPERVAHWVEGLRKAGLPDGF